MPYLLIVKPSSVKKAHFYPNQTQYYPSVVIATQEYMFSVSEHKLELIVAYEHLSLVYIHNYPSVATASHALTFKLAEHNTSFTSGD